MEIGRDFDLQWKTASGLSYMLLQLAVTAGKRAFQRRVQWRPHPARREVTCGDTDMDWPRLGAVLHTTGLWGRSYLGVGRRAASRTWQKLCPREDTGLPWGKPYHGRIHIWDYPKGNQAIWTPSPVQGLTRDPGELTPVLGLASDSSAQSDCRGCLEDSTRVHRPGNWTGGGKRRLYPRVKGNGAASVTPASSSRPLPVTQRMVRNWLKTLESCEGVRFRPARSSADVCQRGAVEWTPSGVGQPLFGDSLPFLLTSVANKELLRAPGAVHVYAQCSYGTQQR